jgi:hypothetical protein
MKTLSLYQPNLDQLGKEISSYSYDSGMAQRLEKVFQEDLKYSERITYERWKSRRIFNDSLNFSRFQSKSNYDAAPVAALAGRFALYAMAILSRGLLSVQSYSLLWPPFATNRDQ